MTKVRLSSVGRLGTLLLEFVPVNSYATVGGLK